uniref:Uncharacterized protein n=1 Tax=Acrobeloides nanus TaxID=290746 RepID=A0A914CWI5_9BILA
MGHKRTDHVNPNM